MNDARHCGGWRRARCSLTREVFRGSPEQKNGYMVANDAPGHGVEVDEKLAAKFPFPPGPPNFDYSWGTTRRRDGTVIRP
jgi:mannonate dehydratase